GRGVVDSREDEQLSGCAAVLSPRRSPERRFHAAPSPPGARSIPSELDPTPRALTSVAPSTGRVTPYRDISSQIGHLAGYSARFSGAEPSGDPSPPKTARSVHENGRPGVAFGPCSS